MKITDFPKQIDLNRIPKLKRKLAELADAKQINKKDSKHISEILSEIDLARNTGNIAYENSEISPSKPLSNLERGYLLKSAQILRDCNLGGATAIADDINNLLNQKL